MTVEFMIIVSLCMMYKHNLTSCLKDLREDITYTKNQDIEKLDQTTVNKIVEKKKIKKVIVN